MIDHETFQARLDDYVDGLLGDEDRRSLRRHLEECSACSGEVDAIARLQTAARGLPREIAPPRDLWSAISARIDESGAAAPPPEAEREAEQVQVIRIESRRPGRPTWWMRKDLLAVAAAVLVLISSAVTAMLVRDVGAARNGPVASGPPVPSVAPGSALVAFGPAEQDLVDTVEQLEFALEAQRDRLSPQTIAVVEQNLQIIDAAIREARAALESDPDNRNLTFGLMDIYKKKVDLLQNAVQLSSL